MNPFAKKREPLMTPRRLRDVHRAAARTGPPEDYGDAPASAVTRKPANPGALDASPMKARQGGDPDYDGDHHDEINVTCPNCGSHLCVYMRPSVEVKAAGDDHADAGPMNPDAIPGSGPGPI